MYEMSQNLQKIIFFNEHVHKAEINEIEKIQGRALKSIFSLPISTSYIGLIMETGACSADQRYNIVQ